MSFLNGKKDNKDKYSWEDKYEHSWSILESDDPASLQKLFASVQLRMRRTNAVVDSISAHRGVIRYLVLVLDLSDSTKNNDLKPDRLSLMISSVKEFVSEFFDQNPMSHLALVAMRNGLAYQLSKLNFNYSEIVKILNDDSLLQTGGKASLQNSLELANVLLSDTTLNGHKEVLVIYGSLSTHDPGNIIHTIDKLKRNNVSVSIIGFSAEVHICSVICKETKGSYNIIINEDHFKNLLSASVPPNYLENIEKAKLVELGFPSLKKYDVRTLCMCHRNLTSKGYFCPRCHCHVCNISSVCPVCNLTLISSPLLAKSYYHLFPVPVFEDVSDRYMDYSNTCFGCNQQIHDFSSVENINTSLGVVSPTQKPLLESTIPSKTYNKCTVCSSVYCMSCDFFIHKRLHNCLGCIAKRNIPSMQSYVRARI